jgi:hypothetical protein
MGYEELINHAISFSPYKDHIAEVGVDIPLQVEMVAIGQKNFEELICKGQEGCTVQSAYNSESMTIILNDGYFSREEVSQGDACSWYIHEFVHVIQQAMGMMDAPTSHYNEDGQFELNRLRMRLEQEAEFTRLSFLHWYWGNQKKQSLLGYHGL